MIKSHGIFTSYRPTVPEIPARPVCPSAPSHDAPDEEHDRHMDVVDQHHADLLAWVIECEPVHKLTAAMSSGVGFLASPTVGDWYDWAHQPQTSRRTFATVCEGKVDSVHTDPTLLWPADKEVLETDEPVSIGLLWDGAKLRSPPPSPPPAQASVSPPTRGRLDAIEQRVADLEAASHVSPTQIVSAIPIAEPPFSPAVAAVPDDRVAILQEQVQRLEAISRGRDNAVDKAFEAINDVAGKLYALQQSVVSIDQAMRVPIQDHGMAEHEDGSLPRFLGGAQPVSGGSSASFGRLASIEDRVDDLAREVAALAARSAAAPSAPQMSPIDSMLRDRLAAVELSQSAISRRLGSVEMQGHVAVAAVSDVPVVQPQTVEGARAAAMAAIRQAAASRRLPPMLIDDAGIAEMRLFETALNALNGRSDAQEIMRIVAEGLPGAVQWQDLAKDTVARHDVIALTTARTIGLERQATSAIENPRLSTLEAIRAERDKWLAQIAAVAG